MRRVLRQTRPVIVWAGVLVAAQGCASTPRTPGTGVSGGPGRSSYTLDAERLAAIPRVVRDAISEKRLPGAVVVVGDRQRVVFSEAFGDRALVPAREPMTSDTIFDVASLTKVVATTPA